MDPKEQLRKALEAARAIAVKAESENRDFTDEERTQVTEHLKAAEAAKALVKKAEGDAAMKAQLDALGAELGLERTPDAEQKAPDGYRAPGRKSIGQVFVESPEYAALVKSFPNGVPGKDMRIQSAPVGLKTLITGAADDSAGAFVQNDATGIFEPLGRRELTLRDLISVRQTGSDTVEFVRQVSRVNAAATVAEATTSAAVGSGDPAVTAAQAGVKPEGGFAFVKVTATVKTIAEWIPASKRGLADARQLRGLIDQELRDDLREEEEDQVLNGDGEGENLEGILQTSGIQSQAYSATVSGLDPLLETSLKAKTKVRTVGRSIPTGYLLNPEDWEKIELARLAKNPNNEAAAGGVQTLHGLPVVQSEAITAGVGLVGDFRKAVLWDREQATISATDSHADFFIRNLVAVLGEERVAFGVTRPAAFVQIDLTA